MRVVKPAEETSSLSLLVGVAPAYDLVISLAAAAHPDRYELSPASARSVKHSLPAACARDLTFFFGDPLSLGLGTIQLIPELPDAQPGSLLRRLQNINPADFVAALLTRGAEGEELAAALRLLAHGKPLPPDAETLVRTHLAGLRAPTRQRFTRLLEAQSEMLGRFTALLEAHATGWFAQRYDEILPFLTQRAKQARRSIGKLPPKELIARVTGGFTLQHPATRSVLLVPSYWAAPFVFVVRDGRDVVLVYGTRPAGGAALEGYPGDPLGAADEASIDVQTVRILKALSDETRLRILQLLTHRPLYGQQLAETLGVSHPTVSHHMALLRIAGLTRTELAEDGNKTYSVQPETIEALCAQLRTAFVEPLQSREGLG